MQVNFELSPLLDTPELLSLMRLLQNSRNIVLCAHRGPDGDAIGSTLGWSYYLRGLGKNVSIVVPNQFPDFLKWLPGSKNIVVYCEEQAKASQLIAGADLICCLDFNTLSRMEEMGAAIEKTKAPRLMIDHHEDPDRAAFDCVISHPELSSTCELVFRLIYQLGGYERMSMAQAVGLYTGMMTDTGAFSYNSERPEIFVIVALLLQKGVEKDKVYNKVNRSWSEHRLKLWSHVLDNNLTFYEGRRASIYTLRRDTMKAYHFLRGDAEGLVNEPLKVRGMKLSISLREDTEKDQIFVSLRSTDGFHCKEMAERFFNGGGHLDAAGGRLPFPMEEAVKTAERAIAAYSEALHQAQA